MAWNERELGARLAPSATYSDQALGKQHIIYWKGMAVYRTVCQSVAGCFARAAPPLVLTLRMAAGVLCFGPATRSHRINWTLDFFTLWTQSDETHGIGATNIHAIEDRRQIS